MWKKCSSCRDDIDFGQPYWKCSVSTCQRNRTALFFCQVSCWDAHLADANHREAWAVEDRAPSRAQWEAEEAAAAVPEAPARVSASVSSAPRRVVGAAAAPSPDVPREVLIVVSKLKKYIKDSSGMKTSDSCAEVLSDYVRKLCDRAVRNAEAAERKTVLDRDFHGLM